MTDFTIPLASFSEKYRTKYLAVYHALRAAILDGTLPEGTRLPATRELAQLYGLSRGSVSQAYDMLHADGYVRSKVGSGTFVAGGWQPPRTDDGPKAPIALSRWGERVTAAMALGGEADEAPLVAAKPGPGGARAAAAPAGTSAPVPISYKDGGPWQALFPTAEWNSAMAWAARSKPGANRSEGAAPAGEPELRAAIAAHLRRSRGIAAEAEHICLFNGSMQAITLLTQLLLGEGEPAVLENPCYYGISRAVAACGGIAVPAALDGDGLVPRDWDARLLFVTPGRQFPTGVVLSHARRRELLAWAARRNAVIVEDDYDSEFRWGGRPLEPLKALDREERVVYVGSFSKTMFAALRVGYAVLPRALVRPVVSAKALYEPVPPARLEQRALARFMRTGGYERHLRRMRRHYGAKQEAFRRGLEQELGELFHLRPADAGLLLYAEWRRTPEEFQAFRQAAAARGVQFRDAATYRVAPGPPAACFAFSHLDENSLLEGVFRMKAAWRDI
ncbi:MAG: PLP-dependent aminotransferase family protein [Paenibacillus sp.]|uniref:MocR-like pyridoxine biosynthesis transcription factor PdxR n=1 Tax=Paenibacillus sp. TaxID=58172 RepID=UPI00290A83FD|nr:PLP-dependent aminotransferase family protein [Paenibacillus sp.]MDU4696593.1 PLP-dependent aminotransferase family protein [Paenibacillus sp.]